MSDNHWLVFKKEFNGNIWILELFKGADTFRLSVDSKLLFEVSLDVFTFLIQKRGVITLQYRSDLVLITTYWSFEELDEDIILKCRSCDDDKVFKIPREVWEWIIAILLGLEI